MPHKSPTHLYSGKKFFPLSPKVEDVDIFDIANSLSKICRFQGHTRSFYSVAQHCIVGSTHFIDPNEALGFLLHDASEAYICDLSRVLKKLPEFSKYMVIESDITEVIEKKYSVGNSVLFHLEYSAFSEYYHHDQCNSGQTSYLALHLWTKQHL